MRIAVVRETAPGEARVALVPEVVGKLRGEEADRAAVAVAEAALLSGQEDLARESLAQAGTPGALMRLGDLLADKKDWAAAGERYRQAWDRDQARPLPLPRRHPESPALPRPSE